jgi:hypothetical protein
MLVDVLHSLGHGPVADDLGAGEKLVTPDVVRVLVRVDDPFRHGGPYFAKQLDHLARVGEIRLRVDHYTTGAVDEARVGIAHTVLLVQDREAVVADLFQVHVFRLAA